MIHHAYDRNQRKLIGPIGSLGEGPFEIIGAAEEGSRFEVASSGWPDLNRRPVALLTDEASCGCVSSHLCSGGLCLTSCVIATDTRWRAFVWDPKSEQVR